MKIQHRRKFFDIAFWFLTALIFLLFCLSCQNYQKLNGAPCNDLYSLPVSSPFFTTMYNEELKEIYLLTDLPLADNRSHYLQHLETCEKIQIHRIEKKGDNLKLTFQLTAFEFLCYRMHLNEMNITYCTRSNQKV